MVGDSEVDEMAAQNASLPFILVEEGYTGKTPKEMTAEINAGKWDEKLVVNS